MNSTEWLLNEDWNPGDGFLWRIQFKYQEFSFNVKIKYKEIYNPYSRFYGIFVRNKKDTILIKMLLSVSGIICDVKLCKPREQVEAIRKRKILAEIRNDRKTRRFVLSS